MLTYESICNIAADQGDDYATGCFLEFSCFKNYYKIIALDLTKQKALDTYSIAIQQINFARNLTQQATICFIIEDSKETVSHFSQGTLKVL